VTRKKRSFSVTIPKGRKGNGPPFGVAHQLSLGLGRQNHKDNTEQGTYNENPAEKKTGPVGFLFFLRTDGLGGAGMRLSEP
jgi:hypothetical protein